MTVTTQHIVICGKHLPDGYSGGRYHAWMMAEALAAAGYRVTVWTNHRPFLARDFTDYPQHAAIELQVCEHFSTPPEPADLLILIPDTGRSPLMYQQALRYAHRTRCRLALLNFESPNWFNHYAPRPRPESQWDHWVTFSRYADLILSSAEESQRWAKDFYRQAPETVLFRFCYPAINVQVADQVPPPVREQRIVCITRLFQDHLHKGGQTLLQCIGEWMRGWELCLLIGTGRIDAELRDPLEEAAARHGVRLVFQHSLSDHDKFRLLKSARAMIFLSDFEGYGYPPVEALYCRTPCLAFDLPVLQEVSGDALQYVPRERREELPAALARLLQTQPLTDIPTQTAHAASFDRFSRELNALVQDVLQHPHPPAIDRMAEAEDPAVPLDQRVAPPAWPQRWKPALRRLARTRPGRLLRSLVPFRS